MEPVSQASAKSEKNPTIMIILSMLGVMCILVIGSIVSVYYLFNKEAEGQTLAEETAQAYATSTAVAHATQVAKYEFFDDFSDNSNNWDVAPVNDVAGRDGYIHVQNGAYTWSITKLKDASTFIWREYEGQKAVQDFDLSVDVKQPEATPGVICPGVAFRVVSKGPYLGAYLFSICDDQQFNVTYYNSDLGWKTLQTWTTSAAIRPAEWNNLAVSARGSHFVLSINNVVVSELDDEHLPRGRIFLVMQVFDKTPGLLWFDNFAFQPR